MQYQAPEVRIEYSFMKNKVDFKINPIAIEHENALSFKKDKGIESVSRNLLNESITSPSRNAILNQRFIELSNIFRELEFENEEIMLTAFNILQSCLISNKTDIELTKTSDNELLLFRKKNGEYSNIIIDEDGDISYIHIGKKLGDEKSGYFPKKNGFDYSEFASML